MPNTNFEPDDGLMIAIAEKFGVLPDTVESEMSDYWFKRVVVQMDAEIIDRKRKEREDERNRK